jgi:hypothetical protein
MKVDETASPLSSKHATQTPFCDVLANAPHKTLAVSGDRKIPKPLFHGYFHRFYRKYVAVRSQDTITAVLGLLVV